MENTRSNNFITRWLPFIIYNIVLLVGSLLPHSLLDQFFPPFIAAVNDKLTHACLHFGLFFFAASAFDGHHDHDHLFRIWCQALAWCVGMGIFIEFAQSFTPSRVADVWDAVANTIGSLIAFIAKYVAVKTKISKKDANREIF